MNNDGRSAMHSVSAQITTLAIKRRIRLSITGICVSLLRLHVARGRTPSNKNINVNMRKSDAMCRSSYCFRWQKMSRDTTVTVWRSSHYSYRSTSSLAACIRRTVYIETNNIADLSLHAVTLISLLC